jgi:hypothetical protein
MNGEILGMEGKIAQQMARLQSLQVEAQPVQVTPQAMMPLLGYWEKPSWLFQLESALGLPPL